MTLPTIVGVGAAASGAAGVTPAFPGGYSAVTNDVAVIFHECESGDTLTVPSGWTLINQQNVTSGTVTKLSAMGRRLQSGDTAPTIADVGNHQMARMIVVNGCKTSGDPWTSVVSSELTSDTSVSCPALTTSVNDCLIFAAFSTGRDVASTAEASAWTNASLSSVTERMDDWTSSGLGGGFAMATGGLATAGSTGNTTATVALANFKALMTVALLPTTPPKTVAPTLVAYTQTAWSGTGTSKSVGASISWETGDEIYVLGMTADEGTTLSAPTVTGLTFNAVGTNPIGGVDNCQGYKWKATAASASSGTIQGNASNTTNEWGIAVWQFRGSDGTGTEASNASTTKTVSMARSNDHSMVIEAIGDWSAAVTTSYAWTPTVTNEREAAQHTNYTTYAANWGDQGSAATTSYGISGTASTGVHTKTALEVLGTVAAVVMPPPSMIVNQAVNRSYTY